MREQTQNTVHASPMAPSFRSGLIVAIVAAIFMAVVGALGTDKAPLLTRTAYWLVVMVSGNFIGRGVTASIHSWGRFNQKPWLEGALVSIAIALPLTFLVVGATGLFFGWQKSNMMSLLFMFAIVLFVSAIMTTINIMLGKNHSMAPPVEHQPEATETPKDQSILKTPRIKDRLPHHLQSAEILALQSEDHYLRVHTDLGSDLILLRLSDAVAETEGLNGAQTHRSWWVAQSAVMRVERSDGRATLYLANGIEAPVSRTYYKSLSGSGWLK